MCTACPSHNVAHSFHSIAKLHYVSHNRKISSTLKYPCAGYPIGAGFFLLTFVCFVVLEADWECRGRRENISIYFSYAVGRRTSYCLFLMKNVSLLKSILHLKILLRLCSQKYAWHGISGRSNHERNNENGCRCQTMRCTHSATRLRPLTESNCDCEFE